MANYNSLVLRIYLSLLFGYAFAVHEMLLVVRFYSVNVGK
jgi:hypothetical protein